MSPPQPLKSAHWIWLKGIGGSAPSSLAWTKVPASRALSAGASSLIILGEIERGKEWVERALLLDPDNLLVRYNAACALTFNNADLEGALDLLQEYFDRVESPGNIHHPEIDPDMDPVREHPRFKEMVTSARQRLGMGEVAANG